MLEHPESQIVSAERETFIFIILQICSICRFLHFILENLHLFNLQECLCSWFNMLHLSAVEYLL